MVGRVERGFLRCLLPDPELAQGPAAASLFSPWGRCVPTVLWCVWNRVSWVCGPAEAARLGTEVSCLASEHCLHRAPHRTGGESGRKRSSAPPPQGRELPCTANRGQCRLKGERASAMKWNPISPTKPSWTELLEHEVQQLLPALLRRDIISIFSFLENYNEFASTEEVLDLLFTKAISCILDIWLEYYQEDFHQLPEFPSLKKLLEFMRQRMPGSDLEHRAWHYLKKFIHLHAAEPEAKASAREQHPEPPQKPAPASTVGPAAPSGPEVIEQVLAAGAEGLARTEIPAAESKPLQIVVTALFHCSTLEEPPAPLATPEEE
ncbi:uncharacterized protein LOC144323453 isoform X1 [Canis aureus]